MNNTNTINWDTTLNMLLSPAEAALLAVIWERCIKQEKAVIISYTLLSKHTNIPTRSVAKHVEKLKQLGFLYVSTNISTNTHSYMIKQSNIVDTCNEICSKRNFIKECQRIRNERT